MCLQFLYVEWTLLKGAISSSPICFCLTDGLSLVNEDGDLRVFVPRNSFITNTTLTQTNTPRGGGTGKDHIACYGGDPQAKQISWHNNDRQLTACKSEEQFTKCKTCGYRCEANGAVGVDPPLNGNTDIYMYISSGKYYNQDLKCQVAGGKSAFIGVYLKDGGEFSVTIHYYWTYLQHLFACKMQLHCCSIVLM